MKQLKKTILTLALLLTAATGARAAWTGGTYTATANENLGAITVNGDATLTINSDVTVTVTGGINVASGTLTVTGPGTLVVNGAKGNNGASGWKGSNGSNGGLAISGNIIVQGGATVTATGGTGGNGGSGALEAGSGGNGGVAIAGTLTYKSGTVTANGGSAGSGGYIDDEERYASSGSAGKAFANDVDFTQTTGYSVTDGTSTIGSVLNQRKVVISGGSEPAAPSGPEVAWDGETKTGTFKMPGGNVTLEPEYFPQATVADGGVTAADADARATTDDPLVKVDATKLTGAKKLMYFVSNSGTTAPAYDAEGWTDQLPTAEGFTQQGIVYVWYYPVGTDEGVDGATATYSDGDICLQSITARIAPEPTYAVTFAEGTDPNEWSASPNTGVKKSQTVTVTYTGSKKVIGVKAEKKAKAPAETTVTLTTGEIGDLFSWDSNSKTINGITIAVSGDAQFHSTGLIDVHGDAGPVPDPDQVYAVGTFTFTSSAGKIKRIDINHNNGGLWYGAGEGWPGSYQVYDNSTFTWSGIPAASVTLNGSHKGFENCALSDVSSIVFTIEPTN